MDPASKAYLLNTALTEYLHQNETRYSVQESSQKTQNQKLETVDKKIEALENKCKQLEEENSQLKNELAQMKEIQEETLKQVSQIKSDAEESQNFLKSKNFDVLNILPHSLSQVGTLSNLVTLLERRMNEFHDTQQESANKVKVLQKQISNFVAKMNSSTPLINHHNNRVPIRSPSTSSFLHNQPPHEIIDVRSRRTPQFQRSSNFDGHNYMDQLSLHDELCDMSDCAENLHHQMTVLKNEHISNSNNSANGNSYSDY